PAADDPLVFGTIFTDHMFIMNYETGKGWHDARIVPYQPIVLEPSAMVFHYGQEMFEGLKAYRGPKEEVLLFRPDKNIERANKTNRRLCIPEIPEEDFLQALKAIVKTDADWIPEKPGTSLYIRPFIIATDPFLGVRPSDTYLFIIILSPVGPYYESGLEPVKIWIEDEYVRAVRGGIGEAKTGGNYVASLKSQVKAHDEGYSQVLWLDGVERKYIEEVGAMNIFFKINGDAVKTMQTRFILDWNQASRNHIGYDERYFIGGDKGDAGMQIVSSGPDQEWEQIKYGYIKMILNAKEYVYLQTPYFIPDESLMDALRIAALSGVKIKLMIPNKPDH